MLQSQERTSTYTSSNCQVAPDHARILARKWWSQLAEPHQGSPNRYGGWASPLVGFGVTQKCMIWANCFKITNRFSKLFNKKCEVLWDDTDSSVIGVAVGESLGMQQYCGTYMQADAVFEATKKQKGKAQWWQCVSESATTSGASGPRFPCVCWSCCAPAVHALHCLCQ
eukprot:1142947-Pelagomonas_calceolata.AAC.3